MKSLILKVDDKFDDEKSVYTYNVINKSIENFDDFLDFLDDDLYKSDLSKIDLDDDAIECEDKDKSYMKALI